jgi:uncharacterized protein (DUF1800 family)
LVNPQRVLTPRKTINEGLRMKRESLLVLGLLLPATVTSAQALPAKHAVPPIHMPYARFGLSPQEAAAHLLSRFTYGPRPGDVDAVVRQGLDQWFAEQLTGAVSDDFLNHRLSAVHAMGLPADKIAKVYIEPGELKITAYASIRLGRGTSHGSAAMSSMDNEPVNFSKPASGKMGVLEKEIANFPATPEGRREFGHKLAIYAHYKGYRLLNTLMLDLYAQKLLRAVYTRNQAREVLTDFWYNHFNVASTEKSKGHLLAYERDAIRPNVLGRFRTLLGATAKDPAMLNFLDTIVSVAPEGAPRLARMPARRDRSFVQSTGLNENYARELLELHTMGVDGGYAQKDIEQIARAFTGWTSYGFGLGVPSYERVMARAAARGQVIRQGSFYFVPYLHDASRKHILGKDFPAGHGLDEGERVLDELAKSQTTAYFIARKLAIRFVSDHPDRSLVKHLAQRFLNNRGNLADEYVAIVESPEFWSPAARSGKVKTGFEYVVSSIRALGGDLFDSPRQGRVYARSLPRWLERMGQRMYDCRNPNGFPDRADYWMYSSAIVNRINFAFALVTDGVPGVQVSRYLNQYVAGPRLKTLALGLLPGVASVQTRTRAVRVADSIRHSPVLVPKDESADDSCETTPGRQPLPGDIGFEMLLGSVLKTYGLAPRKPAQPLTDTEMMMGILIGSPDFQRR